MFRIILAINDAAVAECTATSSADATFIAREWVRGNEQRTAFVGIDTSGSRTRVILTGWVGDGTGVERCPLHYTPPEAL